MKGKFGTALNCIDGRTQIPVIEWLKENFYVDYVDMITEPGMDKVLSGQQWELQESIKEKVMISIEAHDSEIIAVVGHYDCAANPVDFFMHFQDIVTSVWRVRCWGIKAQVIGLWVDELWNVHYIFV